MKKFAIIFLTLFLFSSINAYAQDNVYVVKKGDTLWKISKKYQLKLSDLLYVNPQFANPNLIYPKDKVYIPNPEIDETFKDNTAKIQTVSPMSEPEKVITLVNQYREENGLKPFKINDKLMKAAQSKCQDMNGNSYFSHTSPVYGSPYDMLKKFNIAYSRVGENIARKQLSAEQVVSEWLNSEGHRNNILNEKFTEIGVGYVKGKDSTYWVQMFITP